MPLGVTYYPPFMVGSGIHLDRLGVSTDRGQIMELVKICANCDATYTGRTWNRRYCSSFCAAPFPTWVAGWNLAPHMPDPDNLAVFARWEDAREYLRDSLDNWRDSLSWGYSDDIYDNAAVERAGASMDAAIDALANLLPNMPVEVFANDERGYMWPHFTSASSQRPQDY